MMNLKIFTYEDFCNYLKEKDVNTDHFITRCEALSFRPKFIAMWAPGTKKINRGIQKWYEEEKFIGQVNKHWLCQLEFEKEEDVVYFKLRWL